MRWREALSPEPMTRVAIVTPHAALRPALVRLADSGTVELDRIDPTADRSLPEAARHAQAWGASHPPSSPRLSPVPVDLDAMELAGRADLVAGEAQLVGYAEDAVTRGEVSAMLGWVPTAQLPRLSTRLAEVGAAAVALPRPPGIDPPTATRAGAVRQALTPLVSTYAAVPYVDVDPTVPAALAYMVMFGAMFGDVGHGALLVLAALAVRAGRPRRLAWLRRYWLFGAGAGLASVVFGMAYGECFGPTGLVPTLWLSPLAQPVPLLIAGIGLGTILLAGAYALGTVNRVREGGWALALYAPSGVAGALLFLAAALATVAWSGPVRWLWYAAAVVAVTALALAYAGLLSMAGGGAAGVVQSTVELFDTVIRLGANVVSFARLAAFGLTHAVLGWIVWDAASGLWHHGWAGAIGAVVVFALGNALAFALEALVAGVQALRLEYYELFSRVFQLEGRPFRPWHIPLATDPVNESEPELKEASCSPG